MIRRKFLTKALLIASVLMGGSATTIVTTTQAMAQYRGMSCYQLWYERNAIYANKGYCFRTRRAQNVFGRNCFPPYGRLSRWEQNEVAQIQRWERRKGCR